MTDTPRSPSQHKALIRILIGDVIDVLDRYDHANSEGVRRDVVRTVIAAIEGVIWHFRQEIIFLARELEMISVLEELALTEGNYSVSPQGKLIEQVRHIPIPAMHRFTIQIAKRISPEISIDFTGSGWDGFLKAIEIRNRITHPKSPESVHVLDEETALVLSALFWTLDTTEHCLEKVVSRYRSMVSDMKDYARKLHAADPDAIREYRNALRIIASE